MSIGLKRIGIGAVVLAVVVVLGATRLGTAPQSAEADLWNPTGGSLMTLPSSIPGFVPAIAPASGPGASALALAYCDPMQPMCAPVPGLPLLEGPLTFTVTRVFPSGSTGARFAASGGTTLVCLDGNLCDINGVNNAVAVGVSGGGQNEIVNVQACDAAGSCQNGYIIFVETIFASDPTSHAAGFGDVIISYRCKDVGLNGLTLGLVGETLLNSPGADGVYGTADDVYLFDAGPSNAGVDGIYGTADDAPGPLSTYSTLYSCGADTAITSDDRVTMETDVGILTVEAAAAAGFPVGSLAPNPSIDAACDAGDSVDVVDGTAAFGAVGQWCDLDWADNGVVSYGLRGTGTAGVASVAAQQSGGIGPLRTINVSLAGLAALSLFIDAPELVGSTGGDFSVIITDSQGRPIENQTVECSVSPVGGALLIMPQTGTSDATGNVAFLMVPTGASVVGGEELTITCFLDANPDVRATTTVNLTMAPDLEVVDLVAGCNPLASTWPDGTAASEIAGAVAPADALGAIWKFNPATGTWLGYSPTAPAAASDLTSADRLDAIFVCVDAAATVSRPVI